MKSIEGMTGHICDEVKFPLTVNMQCWRLGGISLAV